MNEVLREYIEDLVSDKILAQVMERNGFNEFINNKGYYYLGSMVTETAKDMNIVVGSIGELREQVTNRFGLTGTTVERTTRHLMHKNPKFKECSPKSVVNTLAGEYIAIKKGGNLEC